MFFDPDEPRRASASEELNLLPPPQLNVALWRSLFGNLRDVFSPKHLPPLKLTSRPVNVGMLVGDILDVPWYRTILSGIGDAISPDTRPPLQLESQPVEVELISDQPAWWRSLLRNLADAVAPERQPALHLTSQPTNPEMASTVLIAPRWSSLITVPLTHTPKLFRADRWKTSTDRQMPIHAPMRTTLVQLPPLDAPANADFRDFNDFESKRVLQLQRSIRASHVRQMVWIGVAAAQVTALVVLLVIQH
ncbi:MAG TPA: hypothetical protein VM912_22050 [Terriglobales bacterium]|nr:hypothetical protein [Terriglobales bacterium]